MIIKRQRLLEIISEEISLIREQLSDREQYEQDMQDPVRASAEGRMRAHNNCVRKAKDDVNRAQFLSDPMEIMAAVDDPCYYAYEEEFQSMFPEQFESLQEEESELSLQTVAAWANSNVYLRNADHADSLHPSAQQKFRSFFNALNQAGISVQVNSTHRYPSHQFKLRYVDETDPTAEPCRSDHQYGYAADINVKYWKVNPNDPDAAPVVVRGTKRGPGSTEEIWAPVVAIARELGILWGGDWDGAYYDPIHFYTRSVSDSQKRECEEFYEERIEDPDTGASADLDLPEDWGTVDGWEPVSDAEDEARPVIDRILGVA